MVVGALTHCFDPSTANETTCMTAAVSRRPTRMRKMSFLRCATATPAVYNYSTREYCGGRHL